MKAIGGVTALVAAGLAAAAWAKPAPVVPATAGHLAPRDECASLAGVPAFRQALAAAVRRRNADALTALSSDDILLGFGGISGPRELRNLMRGAEGPALWRELDALLTLGCAVQDGEIVLPWFFAQEIGGNENYDRLLVAGANVPLYETGSAGAKVLRRLSWVMVRQLDPANERPPRFTRVRLEAGSAEGYVETARLRSQSGSYRLSAQREGKKGWRITAFLAGD